MLPLSSGLGRQLSHGDSVSGSERSPSVFPEHIHPLSSCDQPQQPDSGLPSLPHLSDQLVPDASSKDVVSQHSDTDFEVLRQAISQLRAERQAQLQQQQLLDSQTDCSISPLKNLLSDPICVGSGLTPLPLGQGGPTEDRVAPPTERQRKAAGGEAGDQRDGIPVKVVGLLRGNHGTSNSDASTPSSIQNTAAVAGPSNQPDSTSDRTEEVDQQEEPTFPNTANHGAASSSTASCPVGGNRPRLVNITL